MFNLGSRALFVTSALALVASLFYAGLSTDRLGLSLLLGATVLAALLGGAGVVATGAADRFVFTGDIDPGRSTPVPSSPAPIFAARGAGCLIAGAALGAAFVAAGIAIGIASGIAWFVSSGRQGPAYVPAAARRVSDSITVPFGLPVAATGLILILAVSISRTLLAVSKTASWIIVLVFAAAVFFGGIIIAMRPKITRRMMVAAITVTVLAVGAMAVVGFANGERSFEHHEKSGGGHSEKSAGTQKGVTAEADGAAASDAATEIAATEIAAGETAAA